jgi:hypothetical protein
MNSGFRGDSVSGTPSSVGSSLSNEWNQRNQRNQRKFGCRPSTDVDTERRMNPLADGDNHIEVVVVVHDASSVVSRALTLN